MRSRADDTSLGMGNRAGCSMRRRRCCRRRLLAVRISASLRVLLLVLRGVSAILLLRMLTRGEGLETLLLIRRLAIGAHVRIVALLGRPLRRVSGWLVA